MGCLLLLLLFFFFLKESVCLYRYKLILKLLDKKSDLLARDTLGWTPLLHAVFNSHYTTTGVILRSCPKTIADKVLIPNFENVTPMATAIMKEDAVMLRILADFVDLNKDVYKKFELADWVLQAAENPTRMNEMIESFL